MIKKEVKNKLYFINIFDKVQDKATKNLFNTKIPFLTGQSFGLIKRVEQTLEPGLQKLREISRFFNGINFF